MEEESTLIRVPGSDDSDSPRRSPGLIIAGAIVVVALIITGLLLPPISLGQRLGFGGNETAEEATTADTAPLATSVAPSAAPAIPDGITLSTADTTAVTVAQVTPADFLSSRPDAAMPDNLAIQGDVYTLDYEGAAPTGQIALDLPAGVGDGKTLDLYGWDGSLWHFIPSQIDATGRQVVAYEGTLPQAVTLVQTSAPPTIAVGAEAEPSKALPAAVLPHITEVTAATLTLSADGTLQGEETAAPAGPYAQLLRVTNAGIIVDEQSLATLLADSAAQSAQIDDLVGRVTAGEFAGVNLDYRGVAADQKAAFTEFVSNLASALQSQGKILALTLSTPTRSNNTWDAVGQDWVALGQVADIVYLQLPLNPNAYNDNGTADQLINWATRQIDRYKLTLLVNASAVDGIGESFLPVSHEDALAHFGDLQFVTGAAEVEPGTAVEVALDGEVTPLEWDGNSLTYKFSYDQSGQTHFVWLGNEAALAHRARLASLYHLRGVAVSGLDDQVDSTGYATALQSFLGTAEAPQPPGAAIVWTVRDENDSVLASDSGTNHTFSWDGVDAPGNYTINADFAIGDAITPIGSLAMAVMMPLDPESGVVVEEEEEERTETAAAPAVAPAAPLNPGDADAVVNTNANVRTGPGLAYGLIAGGLNAGSRVQLIGRNADSSWLNIRFPDGQTEGWIFAQLVTVNSSVNVSALPVVEVAAPVAGSGGGGGTTAPPPPPANVSGFALGGQTAGLPIGAMQSAGMTWIKRQHKWTPGNTGQDVAGLVAEGKAAGFKVLLSIPGQLNPSSIDFNAYVNFLGQVAALPTPPDAIEVWNEMNISREWPAGQISPQAYVSNMLAPAYQAIKAANPNIMVISGAPAPTGFYGGGCGGNGCDDAPYVAGMMAAGAGNYSDCVGVHYNEGIMPPAATSGDPRGNGGHYTRYFQGMINAYVNAGARQLCFTEIGYLSGEEWGTLPSGFLWRAPYNLTVAEQAQYLAEAVSLAANSGRVRLMIIFNVDFTTWGDDPQAGYAMIRPDGSCPACVTVGRVMGR